MSAQTLLSGGDKWFSYSGIIFGDVSAPATIQMVFIPNTGLRDSLVQIQPFYANEVSSSSGDQLGIIVKLDDVEIIKQSPRGISDDRNEQTNIFVPRQSKLEILSNNTTGNNTQTRGCSLIGYYL